MSQLSHSKANKKTKTRKHSPEKQFNAALERYQRFQKKNAKFEQEILALIERVSPKIEPYEIKKYQALHALTLRLIPFFSKKTLSEYLREELFEWICTNLHDLSNNPYSHHIDIQLLESTFDTHRNQLIDHQQEKELKKLAKQGVNQEDIERIQTFNQQLKDAETQEEQAELLKEALKDALRDEHDFDESEFESLFDDKFDAFSNTEYGSDGFEHDDMFNFADDQDSQNHEAATLERLFKTSSINKLFRRITRAIHPDLEQDESKKSLRHQQMTQLIQAREQKDVAYILQAYQETFGSLPETFPEQDYKNLTTIIKHLTEQLEHKKYDTLDQIPFGHIYYEFFYHKKPQQEAAAIRRHIQQQKDAANEYAAMQLEIKNLATLKEYLQAKLS